MLSIAQFWCAAQLSNGRSTTRAPLASAISFVRSLLRLSKTTTSSNPASASRQAPMLVSSLRVRMRMEIDMAGR